MGSTYRPKPNSTPGENARIIKNALEGLKRPRIDVKDVRAVEERMLEYLNYCLENDAAPSVSGCANWLGIGLRTLEYWHNGSHGTVEHQIAASKFYGVMEDIWAQKMDNGSLNPVSGIFLSKVFYGYKETQEIVVNHNIQSQLSTADLIAESKRLPGADTLELSDGSQTIDADYLVIEKPIEHNPGQEKAIARKKRAVQNKAERRAAAKTPGEWSNHKEYLKNYYKANKEKQLERNRKSRERKKAAEKAQKADHAEGLEQTTLNFDD